MGYKQALRKIDELKQIVEILEQKQDSGVPQEAVNIALVRINRIFDMIEYDEDYDDADIDTVDYGDGEDLATIENLFAPQIVIPEPEEPFAEQEYNTPEDYFAEESYSAEESYIAEESYSAEESYAAEQEQEQEVEQEVEQETEFEAEAEDAPIVIDYVRAVESEQRAESIGDDELLRTIKSQPIITQEIYADIVAIEPTPAPTPAPAPVQRVERVQRPAAVTRTTDLSNEEEDVQRLVASYNKKRSDRYRKILSLYVDNPIPQPKPQPKAATTKEQIVEKAMERVMVVEKKIDVNALLPDSFKELNDDGIALLTNELFEGDTKSFIATLLTIDEQPNLEEAIFYIAENFVWDGDSDAAKLLFTLLQRRFA